MRFEGTLAKWNDDRGFGFITPVQGGQEIFVHISAFPKYGIRPTLGETLTFEIETDSNGKKRAKSLLCPQRQTVVRTSPSRSSPSSYRRKDRPGFFGRVIPLLIVVGLGVYAYGEYSRPTAPSPAIAAKPEIQEASLPAVAAKPEIQETSLPAIAVKPEIQEASSPYRCDGRTHCSQMTSCAEATYFLRNCPDVEMDGDHDGVPCEQQWCTSSIAK